MSVSLGEWIGMPWLGESWRVLGLWWWWWWWSMKKRLDDRPSERGWERVWRRDRPDRDPSRDPIHFAGKAISSSCGFCLSAWIPSHWSLCDLRYLPVNRATDPYTLRCLLVYLGSRIAG